ncbi:uncharacterized protein [Drosophila takahashii]|uniref:uncharacterized protein isoform X2 n=1 Tax=Drosophila takahashii TaxID=29030 RepID=UPI003898F041
MKNRLLKSACTRTCAVVNAIFKDSTASWASGLNENFKFPVFFSDSVSGAANVAKFFMKRSGILLIAATRPGSIRRRPPPTIKHRHSATRRRYLKWVWISGASINRLSRYTKTFKRISSGITRSMSLTNRCAALQSPKGITRNG